MSIQETQETQAKKGPRATYNKAICRKSGLAFWWREEQISDHIRCSMDVHPLFKGENFTQVERLAQHRHDCTKVSAEVIAALCLFRLTQWNVMHPAPEPETLSGWVTELSEQFDQCKLRSLYVMIRENHSPEYQKHGKFQFNLASVDTVKRLIWLISKCREEQDAGRLEERLIEEASEATQAQAAQAVTEADTEQRKVNALATTVLEKRISTNLATIQQRITFPSPKIMRQWKALRKEVESGNFCLLDTELQEKLFQFIGWGYTQYGNKMAGKLTKQDALVLAAYKERIRASQAWDDIAEQDDEALEAHQLVAGEV